jgi:hypothetical protein
LGKDFVEFIHNQFLILLHVAFAISAEFTAGGDETVTVSGLVEGDQPRVEGASRFFHQRGGGGRVTDKVPVRRLLSSPGDACNIDLRLRVGLVSVA